MDEDYIKAAKTGNNKKLLECLANGVQPDVTNPVSWFGTSLHLRYQTFIHCTLVCRLAQSVG